MQETLLTHESNTASIESTLAAIRQLNIQLDSLLSCASSMEPESIERFDTMLAQRADSIDLLKKYCSDLEKNSEIEAQERIRKFWNGFRIEMTAGDEKRVALLKNKVDLAAQTLRATQKQKALLQYQRG